MAIAIALWSLRAMFPRRGARRAGVHASPASRSVSAESAAYPGAVKSVRGMVPRNASERSASAFSTPAPMSVW
jgi:hypothetical protein